MKASSLSLTLLALLPLTAGCEAMMDTMGVDRGDHSPEPEVTLAIPEDFARPQRILLTENDSDLTLSDDPIGQDTLEQIRRSVRTELTAAGFEIVDDSIEGVAPTTASFATDDFSALLDKGIDAVAILIPASMVQDVDVGAMKYSGAISANLMLREVAGTQQGAATFTVNLSGQDKAQVLKDTDAACKTFVRKVSAGLK